MQMSWQLTCPFLAIAMALLALLIAGNHASLFSATTVAMNKAAAPPMKTVQIFPLSAVCLGSGFAIWVTCPAGTVCDQKHPHLMVGSTQAICCMQSIAQMQMFYAPGCLHMLAPGKLKSLLLRPWQQLRPLLA
jgi:hypothetical protein